MYSTDTDTDIDQKRQNRIGLWSCIMSCGGAVRHVELRSRKGLDKAGGEGAGKEKNTKERTGREGEGWVECEKICGGWRSWNRQIACGRID